MVSAVKPAGCRLSAGWNQSPQPVARSTSLPCRFRGTRSVERLIAERGVPPRAVRLVLVNGRAVGYDHHVDDAEAAALRPAFPLWNL